MNNKVKHLVDSGFLFFTTSLVVIFGLVVSIPSTPLLISIGLYTFWLLLVFLPTYLLAVFYFLKPVPIDCSDNSLWWNVKNLFSKFVNIIIFQTIYIGAVYFLIGFSKLDMNFLLIIRWFKDTRLNEVVDKPESTFSFFSDWLTTINMSVSNRLIIPPLLAFAAYLAMVFFMVRIINHIFSRIFKKGVR